MIDLERVRRLRNRVHSRVGDPLLGFDSLTSTNDYIKQRVQEDPGLADGLCVLAEQQSEGRGTQGRRWLSPSSDDLYLSALRRALMSANELPKLTLAVGLAVARCVRTQAPQCSVALKWPNDVLVNEQKVAGVLIETHLAGNQSAEQVIGIGLNVNRSSFEAELESSATSMLLATGAPMDRERVLAALLDELEHTFERLLRGVSWVVDEAREVLAWRGEHVLLDDRTVRIVGLHDDGSLCVESDGQTRAVWSGRLMRDSR